MVEKAHLSVRIPKELMKDLKIAAIKKRDNPNRYGYYDTWRVPARTII